MEEIEVVATEILDFTVNSLSQEFIYFSYLLGKLDCKISPDGYTYTDGKNGYFSPKFVCESMANNGERLWNLSSKDLCSKLLLFYQIFANKSKTARHRQNFIPPYY